MTRYGTLWYTVRATFMHVMVRYDTLWHVVARYGTLWFRSEHNVQETRVKRDAFLTKACIYIKKHRLIVLFLRERYAFLA